MVYDKCMRLAPWSANEAAIDEDSPLLHADETTNTQAGLLTNLVSQDTYNVMSCVWICHYMWAIPLKVRFFLVCLKSLIETSVTTSFTSEICTIADSSHPVLTLHKIGCKCNSGHRCEHFVHYASAILHWQENIGQLQRHRKVD